RAADGGGPVRRPADVAFGRQRARARVRLVRPAGRPDRPVVVARERRAGSPRVVPLPVPRRRPRQERQGGAGRGGSERRGRPPRPRGRRRRRRPVGRGGRRRARTVRRGPRPGGGAAAGGTLGLGSGVLVLDFNGPAFRGAESSSAELEDALSDLARRLHGDEGLLVVYVNVEPSAMDEEARARKEGLEGDVLIPNSDYEICIRDEGSSGPSSPAWEEVEWELRRLVGRALLPPPVVGGSSGPNSADLMMGMNTFFLSLSFPNVEDASPYVERMCADVDSMEYRVDLLAAAKDYLEGDGDARFDILYQQRRLRSMCRPHASRAPALPFAGQGVIDDALPVVYTVRTAHQAGTWPDDDGGIAKMFELLDLGLRSGAEVLDVESAWDAGLTDALLSRAGERYTSLILGSHHVVGKQVTEDEAVDLYRQCRMSGRAHGTKGGEEGGQARRPGGAQHRTRPGRDRVVQPDTQPAVHARDAREPPVRRRSWPAHGRRDHGRSAPHGPDPVRAVRDPRQEHRVQRQPADAGGAFAAAKLPHTYVRADVETVQEFVDGPIWNDANFGGCSVTIPHKQSIMDHVDVLTDAAREIGSVNTVIVRKDRFGTRVLIGDNTDWRGVYNPLSRRVGTEAGKGEAALILGEGGTARAAAYAAARLGLDRVTARDPSGRSSGGRAEGGHQHPPRGRRVRAPRLDPRVRRPAGGVRRELQAVQHRAPPPGRRRGVRRGPRFGDAVGAGGGAVRAVDRTVGAVRRDEEGGAGELPAQGRRVGSREARLEEISKGLTYLLSIFLFAFRYSSPRESDLTPVTHTSKQGGVTPPDGDDWRALAAHPSRVPPTRCSPTAPCLRTDPPGLAYWAGG
ncbi:hypothetical protein THAOC_04144, partial [Thalassiosira oceanica]